MDPRPSEYQMDPRPSEYQMDPRPSEYQEKLNSYRLPAARSSQLSEPKKKKNRNNPEPNCMIQPNFIKKTRMYHWDSPLKVLNEKEKSIAVAHPDTEIQGNPLLDREPSYYKTFHGYTVTTAVKGEKVTRYLRVVIPNWAVDGEQINTAWDIGTILNVDRIGHVTVQWYRSDNLITRRFKKEDNNQYKLLLYDNSQAGVEHEHMCVTCKESPLLGIRWMCWKCDNVNICTTCYMSDKHTVDHKFIRIISPNSKGVEMSPRRLETTKVECSEGTSNWAIRTVEDDRNISLYPNHLPILGECSDDLFGVWIDDLGNKLPSENGNDHIRISIWETKQEMNLTTQPPLYFIFANSEEDTDMSLMKEIIAFAEKTKLPCHVIGQKVLFHGVPNEEKVGIHYNTDKYIIKELIANGFKKFTRGDIITDEYDPDGIKYFKRLAEYAIGEKVLPVIISINNGGMKEKVRKLARDLFIPIIRLEKDSSDAYVLWNRDHQAYTKTPWRIERARAKLFCTSNEISLLSDIRWDIETLICSLVVGVGMEKKEPSFLESDHKRVLHSLTLDYLTSFAMYLLKMGKWIIPKQYKQLTLHRESLGYVYQQDMTFERIEDLWKSFSDIGYKLPGYEDDYQNTVIFKWDSECYGLIFLTLLQNHYLAGATQLVEMGYIGIHHILFGCFLLEEKERDWKTTTSLKEFIQRLKSAYIERAILITSCIYDADRRKEATEGERESRSKENSSSKSINDLELSVEMNHGERLLLNHGYLRDAILTKNITFLENDTVKKIVNKKWYGIEQINWKRHFSFVFLAAVHIFVLPILMITMETGPLLRLYKKYQIPFLKVVIHMLGFLALFAAYAYMLLFDYSADGISNTDYFIMVWIASFFVDEIKQVCVALIRGKLKNYINDWWNIIDWLFIIVYTFGMGLREGEGAAYQVASKCVLVAAFMLLCIRILNLCCMTEFLGPKLVIIRKMVKETIAFMIIMTVIMVWYSVSFYSLLYPNSEFSWTQMEKVFSNGYWMLFGELNLDGDTLTIPDCTFNRTVYESGILQRCPTKLGLQLTPYLKAFYVLIAVVLLLNLLIAMYSDTFNAVQQKSNFYWRQIQSECLEEYSLKTVFPIHLQLLALPGTICALLCLLFLRKKIGRKDFNERPMIIRVFLYDCNYDLELPSTKKAEEKATVQSIGKIDIDFDSIKNSEMAVESGDKRELMNRLEHMEDGIHKLHQMVKQLAEGKKEEKEDDDVGDRKKGTGNLCTKM